MVIGKAAQAIIQKCMWKKGSQDLLSLSLSLSLWWKHTIILINVCENTHLLTMGVTIEYGDPLTIQHGSWNMLNTKEDFSNKGARRALRNQTTTTVCNFLLEYVTCRYVCAEKMGKSRMQMKLRSSPLQLLITLGQMERLSVGTNQQLKLLFELVKEELKIGLNYWLLLTI